MSQLNIGIIVGSTRPGRIGRLVGDWVQANASHSDVTFELVDLHNFNLPLLEEMYPMGAGNYSGAAANAWAQKISEFDGFIFVTAEYNHSVPGALKNAIDYVNAEWANKAAGIISYGSMGGVRAAEHLRQIMGELKIADVRQTVMLSLFTDFTGIGTEDVSFTPAAQHTDELETLVSELTAWAGALRQVRVDSEEVAA